MLSEYQNGTSEPVPTPFNLAEYVLAAGVHAPDKTALAVVGPGGARRMRYGELRRAVLGVATGLLESGGQPGDRVLLRLGNQTEFPIAFLGAIAAGLIPVPTSAQLTGPEITGLASLIDPALVLASDGIALPGDRDRPVIGTKALTDMHDLPPADFVRGDPDRPAYIVFTSGTSGRARAVVHAHRAIWARRMMWAGWYGLHPDDRLMHAGAFNWTFTLGTGLLDPWAIGATALIPAPGTAPAQLPLLLKRHDATIFAAAPGVFRQMLRADIAALPRLRHALSAGEKLPEALRAQWHDATGLAIYEAFGMSECSTLISSAPGHAAPPGTLGFAQPGRHVAILGPDHRPVERGSEGVIAIHRDDPGLMLGYWSDPAATAARFAGDWFLTGDRASMDEGGAITYLGRDDDMMNAGGFRVSPVEVETAMADFPGLTECAAIEVPVRADVKVIALYYVAKTDLDEVALTEHAAARLARFKQPRKFVRIAALPRGTNNKILRSELRRKAENDQD